MNTMTSTYQKIVLNQSFRVFAQSLLRRDAKVSLVRLDLEPGALMSAVMLIVEGSDKSFVGSLCTFYGKRGFFAIMTGMMKLSFKYAPDGLCVK